MLFKVCTMLTILMCLVIQGLYSLSDEGLVMMMMNDDHNGEGDNDDGEDNEFLSRIQRIHHKNPGFEATRPTRRTIQRLPSTH